MTINHIFVWASTAKAQSLQAFYRTILKPIGYSELIRVNDGNLVGYGRSTEAVIMEDRAYGKR
ncbi:hypothetical protein N7481_007829 [Penicillium waksmanii]|uniref:uncharacterized protein n=1 Tax=Penicillium waksmanii TaxID=69791 RepID=UPI002548AB3B|nr:uncharacterized protein N7481_007829 [Penicillium waksmanii]KAJ5980531.1 hypothetical protein N7481_007829 [Penicillium waksmanii]